MLGLGWSLLQPVAMTIVLCTVFAGVFGATLASVCALPALRPDRLELLFHGRFFRMQPSFIQGESYIRQHRAPLAMYPLRTTLGAGYHFLVGMVVVFVATGFFSGFQNPIVLLSLVPSMIRAVPLCLDVCHLHGHVQCALPRHATPAGNHLADRILPDADHLQAQDPH